MARKRIIEGRWTCTSCGASGIRGREKRCTSCGSPREAGAEMDFDFGGRTATGASTAESVTDAQDLAAAQAGADWFCAACEASNPGGTESCTSCGAPRGSAAAPLAPPEGVGEGGEEKGPGVGERPKRVLGKALLIVGCCVGAAGFWATRTHEVIGQVDRVSWQHDVQRQTFTATVQLGWEDQLSLRSPVMPVQGAGEDGGVQNIRDCHEAQRGTREVPDGQEQVCTTITQSVPCGTTESCTVTDLGNGFAEETCTDVTNYCDESYEDCTWQTKYRTEPVYDTQCSYDTYEWRDLEVTTAAGSTEPPAWPTVETDALDRLKQSAVYQVGVGYVWKDEKASHDLAPETEAEFLRWRSGASVVLVVNNLGAVDGIALASELDVAP